MDCINCHSSLSETADYCYNCGGKVIRNRLTFRNLFESFGETFLNYDNKFLQTFINLFKKPENIIVGYIHGTRKKYVDVISYFAIALTISGIQMLILNKFFPELMNMDMIAQKGAEEFNQRNLSFTQEYQSLLYMLAVPFYAFISKIVFWNYKTFNYTEHLVINMYLSAHFAIVSAILIVMASLLGIKFIVSATVIILLQIIYSAYCFKRILKLDIGKIILQTLIFLILLGLIMFMIIIISIAMMYLTGDMNKMLEAQKAARDASIG